MGVLQIRNSVNGKVCLGSSSTNLPAIQSVSPQLNRRTIRAETLASGLEKLGAGNLRI